MQRRKLGVNIDHIATLRQARGTSYPDPVAAASLAELAGADQITVHLREDRRHIQDRDVKLLRQTIATVLNLEMAATQGMVLLACQIKPDIVTLVPERRQELTTEGGLDVHGNKAAIGACVEALHAAGITVSLFIDPSAAQIDAAAQVTAPSVELHTGQYCEAKQGIAQHTELKRLRDAGAQAQKAGLRVACGHGLHYHNIQPLVPLDTIEEYNIGHSIVAQAAFVGLDRAVKDMLALLTV